MVCYITSSIILHMTQYQSATHLIIFWQYMENYKWIYMPQHHVNLIICYLNVVSKMRTGSGFKVIFVMEIRSKIVWKGRKWSPQGAILTKCKVLFWVPIATIGAKIDPCVLTLIQPSPDMFLFPFLEPYRIYKSM